MFKALLFKMIMGGAVGFLTGVADDAHTFRSFRQRNQFAEFDWFVAIARWVSGAIYGALAGAGIAVTGV